MDVVGVWTGRHATALRMALRLTNEGFAELLGTAVRTVAKWNSDPDVVPMPELQRALDTTLDRLDNGARARFAWLVAVDEANEVQGVDSTATELRLANDPVVSQVLDWLDAAAGWQAGSARRQVAALVGQTDLRTLQDKAVRHSRIGRAEISAGVAKFYGTLPEGHCMYRAKVEGITVATSILTRSDWLNLGLRLEANTEHAALDQSREASTAQLDHTAARAATMRLAVAVATGTKIVNAVLYRLLRVAITQDSIDTTLGLSDFVTYAMTLDLLEDELIEALSGETELTHAHLPLRAQYLPTAQSVLDVSSRLCAGGPVALFAAARPARRGGGLPDYVLLVQERSGKVLNSANRLAVIPKGFHQPLVDFSDDARISATLEREMEEELFGRPEVDSTLGDQLRADPLHMTRLSQPMRWLIENDRADQWRMESTGFGFNLVSGNFEAASLIVIDDEEWWNRFGGHIEANWESSRLRRYSSLDAAGVGRLVHDVSWSNEGLFAFLQGLRRLKEIGRERVDLPTIEWEL